METVIAFIYRYLDELAYLSLEMAPWLLLGLIFAGLLKIWFPQEVISKHLGKRNFKSVAKAALLGIPLPLCSCGVIPTGVAFYKNGASKGATNSFLISTPQTGVDSVLATYSLLGLPFAIIRPFVALATGIIGGVFTNIFERGEYSDKNNSELKVHYKIIGPDTISIASDAGNDNGKPVKSFIKGWGIFWNYAFVELLQDIAKWLVIGFLGAALIALLIPDNFFEPFKGAGVIEILTILLVSVPLYICATGSIPIAAVLLMKGISPGAALVFLMAGPATNVATMTVIGRTMGKRALYLYLLSIIGGAVLFGLAMNTFVPSDWLLGNISLIHAGHQHEFLPEWIKIISLVILGLSTVGGYFYQKIEKRGKMEKTMGVTVKVAGMTCSHCEATVIKNLEAMGGIEKVVADHRSDSVKITGSGIDLKKVEQVINGLGYNYIG